MSTTNEPGSWAEYWREELAHLQRVAANDGYHEVIRQHARWKATQVHTNLRAAENGQ
jgi:hypothetical protein